MIIEHNNSHPSEPQCSYDPVEGLTLAADTDPLEKIKELENQICKILWTNIFSYSESSNFYFLAALKGQLYSTQSGSSPPQRSITATHIGRQETVNVTLPKVPSSLIDFNLINSTEPRVQTSNQSPELQDVSIKMIDSDPFMDLLYLGWNPDLPDPVTLNH